MRTFHSSCEALRAQWCRSCVQQYCRYTNSYDFKANELTLVQLNPEDRTVLPAIAFRSFATNYVEPDLDEGFQDITRMSFEVWDYQQRSTARLIRKIVHRNWRWESSLVALLGFQILLELKEILVPRLVRIHPRAVSWGINATNIVETLFLLEFVSPRTQPTQTAIQLKRRQYCEVLQHWCNRPRLNRAKVLHTTNSKTSIHELELHCRG